MATVEHTATMTLGKIPVGRRVLEIMNEKGSPFTSRALAERLGENRETFRQTLLGNRPMSLSLFERLADVLGVSEERIRQLDTFKKEEELVSLLQASSRTKVMLIRAHSLALELVEVAIGATERGYALNNLGRAHFLMQQYEEAHFAWKEAFRYAKEINAEFTDSSLVKIVSANLMMSGTRLKDFGGAEEMLNLVVEISSDDPDALGMVAYSRMVMYGERGNLELAKTYALQSLDHFRMTGEKKQIGHGHINLATIEYLLGNYAESASVLANALEVVQDYSHILVRVVKDYVRSLMKLRDYETATDIVEKHEFVAKDYPEYWNKIQVMNTVLKNDPSYADVIAKDLHASLEARTYACRCLFEFYAKRNDANMAMRYYELERKYTRDNSEFIDGEVAL